ncbi:integrase arm-type DNA-binding domain-containing protein [Thalassococcus sp. CAU 1522]|uniref:Integrase arm-type DNA-binding domain-containing protein n=1 Tax=Thalassococcus arenae TaxID=2851652 RepID=A0ABS6ND34_9RHOB|nr:site-specific integrase [Thalassococcus arenae]MBV2361708.1 integrase arm-type DNA-binding domain-containing protein [Thalassococcus arenae]
MARPLHKLSAATVKAAVPGKYSDGGGLWLHKRRDGGGQWFLRVTVHGRRREMGLGSINEVTLKEAREQAEHWRLHARKGIDPIKEREKQRREAERNLHCLADVALDAFESRKAELKGDGKAGRWFSPLELHVLPKLGEVPVSDIDQIDIRDALKPIWHSKGETARKALNRLSIVLRHAAALGLDVDLQATEKAKALLGKSRHTPQHIAAMPWIEVPDFYRTLEEPTTTNLALRMLILTAVRSGPLRFMRYDQIEGEIWTIPAEQMKGRLGQTSDFRVPLSDEALQLVDLARPFDREGYLFPGLRKGVISDMTMGKHMKKAGLPFRPHGFRSSFRDWLAEQTRVPREIAETCLGHVAGSQVERAYLRTDFLEQRCLIMTEWARFVTGENEENYDDF